MLLLELDPPFDKRDVQLARRRQAKVWHPDLAPPGKRIEHERHLKAINEAADQLERLAEDLARRHGQPQRRESERRGRAQAREPRRDGATTRPQQRRRAAETDRATHDPFGSQMPDHSVVHRYARCLSYPEWGVGDGRGHLLHGRRRRRPAMGAGALRARHPHRAGRLAAVRRLQQARPRRRPRPAFRHRRRSTRSPRATSRSPPSASSTPATPTRATPRSCA